MSEVANIKHCGTLVEGQMLVDRLNQVGIRAYVQESVPRVRSKLYSGSMGTMQGVDIYVNSVDQERARELLNHWDGISIDEDSISQESESAAEIAEDVKEYLAEQEVGDDAGILETVIWGGDKKMQLRILILVVLIVFAGIILIQFFI